MLQLIPWTPPLQLDRDQVIAEHAAVRERAADAATGRYLLQYRGHDAADWQDLERFRFAANAAARRDKEAAIVADPGSPFTSRYDLPPGHYRVTVCRAF